MFTTVKHIVTKLKIQYFFNLNSNIIKTNSAIRKYNSKMCNRDKTNSESNDLPKSHV